jgi:hypothetical protein
MMLTNEFDELLRVSFQSLRSPSRLVNNVVMPGWLDSCMASSVYLSESVWKMP